MNRTAAKLCNRYSTALKLPRRRVKRAWNALNAKERAALAGKMRRFLKGDLIAPPTVNVTR